MPGQAQHAHGGRAQHLDRAHGELADDRAALAHATRLRAQAIMRLRTHDRHSGVGGIGCRLRAPRRPRAEFFLVLVRRPSRLVIALAREPDQHGVPAFALLWAVDVLAFRAVRSIDEGEFAVADWHRARRALWQEIHNESTPHRRRGRRRIASIRAGAMRDVHIAVDAPDWRRGDRDRASTRPGPRRSRGGKQRHCDRARSRPACRRPGAARGRSSGDTAPSFWSAGPECSSRPRACPILRSAPCSW